MIAEVLLSLRTPLLPTLTIAGALFAWHGLGLLRRPFAHPADKEAPFWLVRGGRALIIALACAALVSGLASRSPGMLYFGLAFLGEEIYETGMVLLILRHGLAPGRV